MPELTPDQLRRFRLRAQRLHPRASPEALLDVVRAMGGVQAQSFPAMMLALRARIVGLTTAHVERALNYNRLLVRTWAMRGTLHLLLSEDIRWMVDLLAPTFITSGKRRRQQLGLDDDTAQRGVQAIRALLDGAAPMTRGEIVAGLAERGIGLDRRGQAPIHLIGFAALEGVVCLGADRPDGESTYVLTDQWVGEAKSLPREQALVELARRYFDGYAPASVKDFAAWSGLSQKDARRGWDALHASSTLVEVEVEGRKLWLPASALDRPIADESSVNLLSAFDAYVLGYAERRYVVDPAYQPQVYHGGQTVPVVLVDGEAMGTWRYRRRGKRLNIVVHPFMDFDQATKALIAEDAEDIGRLWDSPVMLTYSDQPV